MICFLDKIWRNNYLKNVILRFIRLGGEIKFNKLAFPSISSRLEYNNIHSLKWMIENNQYSMIIDKIKSNHYVYIDSKSIRSLIVNCKRVDVFQILLENKRNDMEKLDLIEESVRQDSVFSLKTLIQIYGGYETVAKSFGYGTGYSNGTYTSLLDIAISFSSLNVANYLLSIGNGLEWYTESILIKNVLSHKINYFNSLLDAEYLLHGILKVKRIKGTKERMYLFRILQYEELIKIANDQLKTAKKKRFDQQNIKLNTMLSSLISQYKKTSIQLKMDINNFNKPKRPKRESIDRTLDFIKFKLGHSIETLLEKYKQESKIGIDKLFQLIQDGLLNIIDGTNLILNGCFSDPDSHEVTNSDIPYNQFYTFRSDYKDNINYIKYNMLVHSYRNGVFTLNLMINFLNNLSKPNESDNFNETKQLLELVYNQDVPFPLFYIYYIDYHFSISDFKSISKVVKNLPMDAINHLWLMILHNYSIEGLQFYHDSGFTNYEIKNPTGGWEKRLISQQSYYNHHPYQFAILVTENNLILPDSFSMFFNNLFIGTVDPYEVKGDEYGNDGHNFKYSIQWDSLFKHLLNTLPIEYLELLISTYPNIKTYFDSCLCKNELPRIFFLHSISIENDTGKLKLFKKHYRKKELRIVSVFEQFSIYGVKAIDLINHIASIKIGNKIGSIQLDSLIKLIYFSFYENSAGKSTFTTLQESIENYKLFNVTQINQVVIDEIGNYNFEKESFLSGWSFTLQNCLFNNHLINSILNNDFESLISILSICSGTIINDDTMVQLKSLLSTSSIEFINYCYSNNLFKQFGSSLLFSIIENLIQFKCPNTFSLLSFEQGIIDLFDMVYKSDPKSFQLNKVDVGFYTCLLNNKMDKLFNHLMKLQEKNQVIKTMVVVNEYEYDQIKYEIYQEHCNKLMDTNGVYQLFLLFTNGNVSNLISLFKSNVEQGTTLELNSLATNLYGIGFHLNQVLKLSIKYCNFEIWQQVYNYIIKRNLGEHKKNLLNWVFKYNRLDILDYLFEKEDEYKFNDQDNEGQLNLCRYLDIPFKKGYWPICNYLINSRLSLFNWSTVYTYGIEIGLYCTALVNGNIEIANLLVDFFNRIGVKDTLSLRISKLFEFDEDGNGCGNLNSLKSIINTNSLIVFFGGPAYMSVSNQEFIQNLISFIIDKNSNYHKSYNRILYFIDSLQKTQHLK